MGKGPGNHVKTSWQLGSLGTVTPKNGAGKGDHIPIRESRAGSIVEGFLGNKKIFVLEFWPYYARDNLDTA